MLPPSTKKTPGGDKYICAYIVADKEITPAELKKFLSKTIPVYMIPSYFVPIEKIPLTPNGKIDRKALPVPEIKTTAEYEAPRDEIEEKLVEIWNLVLGREAAPLKIGIDDNFFDLGGHSLKTILMTAKIHKELNINIPLTDVFKTPTIRGLSRHIRRKNPDIYKAVKTAEKKEYYELSSAQKRLYVIQQMDLQSIAYNMPLTFWLTGKLQKRKFEEAFRQLIKRHESFRTSFEMVNGESVQHIHESVDFKIEYSEPGKSATHNPQPGKNTIKTFIRPFDLSHPPLLRSGCLKIAEEKHLLVVDMHHIISDEVSHQIFINDLLALYRGKQLPQLRLQYKDFSKWQNNLIKSKTIKKQQEYWLKTFAEEIPLLRIPTDYERPDILHFEGHTIAFEIGSNLYAQIKNHVAETKTTLNIVLLAVYNILLSKYTGQKTILVGNVIAGRRHADLHNIIGFFVNMLAMKNSPEDQQSFEDFLEEVKKTSINAYENQDYQFEELVSLLEIEREPGRHPLIDTVFVLQDLEDKWENIQSMENSSLKASSYKMEHKVAHFDLMLHATVMNNSISMIFEYSTALFKQTTIEELSKCYLDVIQQVVKNKKIKLEEITISHDIMTESSDVLHDQELSFEF